MAEVTISGPRGSVPAICDNMTFADAQGGATNIPSAVLLGLFAVISTASIAKRVFGRRDVG